MIVTPKASNANIVVITPSEEDDWLTSYKDTWDILSFTACKKVMTLAKNVSKYREITNDEYEAYELRYELAMAEQEEAFWAAENEE